MPSISSTTWFAGDRKLANDGILTHRLGHGSVVGHPGVLFDVIDGVADVTPGRRVGLSRRPLPSGRLAQVMARPQEAGSDGRENVRWQRARPPSLLRSYGGQPSMTLA